MLSRLPRFTLAALLVFIAIPSELSGQVAKESTLYTFTGGADGAFPNGVIQASDGNFYGTAVFGGNNLQSGACDQGVGCGTVFRITPSGNFTVLYTFMGGIDGSYPNPLVQGSDGNFYGTTIFGGSGSCVDSMTLVGCGTIFQISPSGTLTTLYSFSGGADGSYPNQLVQGSDGKFYGTTIGTVFQITLSGNLTTLYTFTGQGDGSYPLGLVQGSSGDFYGATQAGGSFSCEEGCGTVFSVTSSGSLTTLYSFTGGGDSGYARSGPDPKLIVGQREDLEPKIVIHQPKHIINNCPPACSRGNLAVYSNPPVEYSDGSFYSTNTGQDFNPTINGTVFNITTSGTLTTRYSFPDDAAVALPLVLGSDGNFYGEDLVSNTVYQVTPSGGFTSLFTFSEPIINGLVQGSDGSFYGSTASAGGGTLFKLTLSPTLAPPVKLSLLSSSISFGSSVPLTWSIANGFSSTLEQCYASVQGNTLGAGNWSGLQTGTLIGGEYSGSATLTPTQVGAYTYALTCGGTESGFATLSVSPADFTLTASPSSATVAAGQSGIFTISVMPQGLFTTPVSFSCTGQPAVASCSFSPTSITPNSSVASTTLTVNAVKSSLSLAPNSFGPGFASLYAIWLALGIGLMGISLLSATGRKKVMALAFCCLLTGSSFLLVACGGGSTGGSTGASHAITYTISVTGTAGSIQHAISVTLIAQ